MKVLLVVGADSAAYILPYYEDILRPYIERLIASLFGVGCEVKFRLEAEQYPPDGLHVELRDAEPDGTVEMFEQDMMRFWNSFAREWNIPNPHANISIRTR